MSNGRGGSDIVIIVVFFFIAVFVLTILYVIGQGFIKFSDRNPGIILLAIAIDLLVWHKVFREDNTTSSTDKISRENKVEESKNPIQELRNSFLYGQRESVIITLNMIATIFNSNAANKSKIDYIINVGKILGVSPNDSLYHVILSRYNNHSNFMVYISSMNQQQRDHLCMFVEGLTVLTAEWDRSKKDVARAILLDAKITDEEYRKAIAGSNLFIKKYINR